MGDILKKYSENFFALSYGREDFPKHTLLLREDQELYILIVSQSDEPLPDYNVMITVIGPRKERSTEIMKDFEVFSQLETTMPPDYLVERLKSVDELISGLQNPKRN